MKTNHSGKIITFYSYKGGTGRSMMLANVAWILASNGKKVLSIDWDLEAPGLHRYFYPFLTDKELAFSDGVINFVTNYKIKLMTPPEEGEETPDDWYLDYANIKEYASTLNWDFEGGGRLDFVPPGRQDDSYSTLTGLFSWQDFYERLGGKLLLREMQRRMRIDYDYVLIDSRTGVSDTSGICTIEMPDAVVVCFTLNYQSINGASNIAKTILEEREKLVASEMASPTAGSTSTRPFEIFPVPTRLEYAEKEKLDFMRNIARQKFLQFPITITGKAKEKYWEETFFSYEAYYAYEEVLTAFGETTRGGKSLLASAEQVTSLITGGMIKQLPILPHPKRDEIIAAFAGRRTFPEVSDGLIDLAEKTFSTLNQTQQQVAREVLLRLVRVTPPEAVDKRNSRQRFRLKEFDATALQMIETLRNSQVLEITQEGSSTEEFVQLSNDSLVQDWKRMREWIEADRSFLLWRQDLRSLVEQWDRNRSDERLLLRGAALRLAGDTVKEIGSNVGLRLTATELDFIHTSLSNRKSKQPGGQGLHVFVIMPFGLKEAVSAIPATKDMAEKPALNINFDEVYDFLISPALIKAGCVPVRADYEPGAGDIRTDMYFELVTADAVLADISILNANVFYELGVRHGVAPRGVFMIHGGWVRRPFDVAPDRTFDYEGKLFLPRPWERTESWRSEMDYAVERLAGILRGALDVDEQTLGSPVYKELVGLVPVDWRNIQTARAKYFGEVFTDWKARVAVAKANGWPGDILTLADDAPTRFHRVSLLWEAAAALVSMQRFDVGKSVLEDLLKLDPHHRRALPQYGLVLGRLGKFEDARIHMLRVADELNSDTEAQGILGRTYKDLWKLEWQSGETLEERQKLAIQSSGYAAEAIDSYFQATRAYFDYYNGINVASLLSLLRHLEKVTNTKPADTKVKDLDGLISLVRFAVNYAVESAKYDDAAIWATATLGELELVTGDAAKAVEIYTRACYRPGVEPFHVDSMLQQVRLFESLGFRSDALKPIREVLEQRSQALAKKISGPKKTEQKFRKVVVASGHMIDGPERKEARFPATKEPPVKERIGKQLDNWKIAEGDLTICGGARGADILFAEASADRGAEVWVMLPLAEPEFLEASVRLPDSDWEDRYYNLRDRENVKLFFQPDRLKAPPKGVSVFARNNLWMINTARVLADDPARLYALLVWDENPTGDGPGGTSDFAVRIKKLGGRLAPIINPTKL
jgi:hypothetical protein